jgi:hypothetical protein
VLAIICVSRVQQDHFLSSPLVTTTGMSTTISSCSDSFLGATTASLEETLCDITTCSDSLRLNDMALTITTTGNSAATPAEKTTSPPSIVHLVPKPRPYMQLCFHPTQNSLTARLVGGPHQYSRLLREMDLIESKSSSDDNDNMVFPINKAGSNSSASLTSSSVSSESMPTVSSRKSVASLGTHYLEQEFTWMMDPHWAETVDWTDTPLCYDDNQELIAAKDTGACGCCCRRRLKYRMTYSSSKRSTSRAKSTFTLTGAAVTRVLGSYFALRDYMEF